MVQLYTIFDGKAEYFMPIFTARNDNEAKRMFIGSLGDSFMFREDYNLFCIGEFDDEKGVLTPLNAPLIVLSGAQISEKFNPNPVQEELPVEGIGFPSEGDNFTTLNAKENKK
jgi:hypothetical protein